MEYRRKKATNEIWRNCSKYLNIICTKARQIKNKETIFDMNRKSRLYLIFSTIGLIGIAAIVALVVMLRVPDKQSSVIVKPMVNVDSGNRIAANKNIQATKPTTVPGIESFDFDSMNVAWEKHRDFELGIEFEFPKVFETIESKNESSSCTFSGVPLTLPICQHRALYIPKLGESSLFLAAYGLGFEHVGRGAYWGDAAGKITNEEVVKLYCNEKTKCKVYSTAQGLKVAKREAYLGFGEGEEFVTYYLYPGIPYLNGIAISTERLAERVGKQDAEFIIDRVVESLRALNEENNSDWRTYTNQQALFGLNIPPGYSLKEQSGNSSGEANNQDATMVTVTITDPSGGDILTVNTATKGFQAQIIEGCCAYYTSKPIDTRLAIDDIEKLLSGFYPFATRKTIVSSNVAIRFYRMFSYGDVWAFDTLLIPREAAEGIFGNIVVSGPFLPGVEHVDETSRDKLKEKILTKEYLSDLGLASRVKMFEKIIRTLTIGKIN